MELGDLAVGEVAEVAFGHFAHHPEVAAVRRPAGAHQRPELGEVVGPGDGETGSIEAGKWADFAVVEALAEGPDRERAALEAAAGGGVAATVAGGRALYDRIGAGTD